MIDDFKTAKALLDKAQTFADYNSIRLCIDGLAFTPETDETYLKEALLQNETEIIALDAYSCDRQQSIYQLSVYTPKANGKFANLELVNEIKKEFRTAAFVVYDNQTVQIMNVSASPLLTTNSHNITAVSINIVVLTTSA